MPNFTPEQIEQFLEQFFDVVGRRQYIGARYVPIFGRKDESSIAWDNTKPYEPLTIVLYQGNSYTSRTYVPTGIAITDTDYWANTGNYNAQIEQYREDVARLEREWPAWKQETENELEEWKDDTVADFETAIDDIPNIIPSSAFSASNTVKDYVDQGTERNCIYIGNSYTAGADAGMGIFYYHNKYYDHAYSYTEGGAGFLSYVGQPAQKNFVQLLQDAINDTSFDNDTITDILFLGAWGDSRALYQASNDWEWINSMKTALETVNTLIANNFREDVRVSYAWCECRKTVVPNPNAEINAPFRIHKLMSVLLPTCQMEYLGWIGWNLMFVQANVYQADNYHPNRNGSKILATQLENALHGNLEYRTLFHETPLLLSNLVEGMTPYTENTKILLTPDCVYIYFGSILQGDVPASYTHVQQNGTAILENYGADATFGLPLVSDSVRIQYRTSANNNGTTPSITGRLGVKINSDDTSSLVLDSVWLSDMTGNKSAENWSGASSLVPSMVELPILGPTADLI